MPGAEDDHASFSRRAAQNGGGEAAQQVTGDGHLGVAVSHPIARLFESVGSGLPQGRLAGGVVYVMGVVLGRYGEYEAQREPTALRLVGGPGQGEMPVPVRVDAHGDVTAC